MYKNDNKTFVFFASVAFAFVGIFTPVSIALAIATDPGDVCFEATGFGSAIGNGIYQPDGIAGPDNITAYSNPDGWFIWNNSSFPEWSLGHDVASGEYYNDNTVPNGGTWVVNGGGAPAGTVSVVTCPGPDVEVATSTKTISNPNQDLANGFFLFFLGFYGIYWMFSKRR